MLLTEEQKQDVYPAATLENVVHNGGTAISIEQNYYYFKETYVVAKPKSMPAYQNNNGNPPYNNNPYSNTTANNAKVYKTNATINKIGLGITLKVMSGDVVNIFGKSWHKKPAGEGYDPSQVTNNTVLNILNTLVNTNTMSPKGFTGLQLQPNFPAATSGIFTGQSAFNEVATPKASINWIIFDEQFKYVSAGFDMVGKDGAGTGILKRHQVLNISIPKNGYIYVYCNNESNYDVFFDNLQVIHNKSAILEETHYYPFGLTMAGISSKAANMTPNKRKYNAGSELQSEEFSDGSGLDFYDVNARTYNAQIGRFMQIDPLTDIAEEYSGYSYSLNNPVSFNDPSGLKEEPENPHAGNGNPGNGIKIEEPVVVRTDKYRKKVHDYYNSLNRHDWELIAFKMQKKGYNDNMIREHFSNLSDGAKYTMEKGISFNNFNEHRYGATRAGDKIALNVLATLIPYGRIVKWGGKGVQIIAKTIDKPVVKAINQVGSNFIKEVSKEIIANRGDITQVDLFDVGIGTFTGGKDFGLGKSLAIEAVQASVDYTYDNGNENVFNGSKTGINAGADFLFGSMKVGADKGSSILHPKGNQTIATGFEILGGQIMFEVRKATEK